MSAAIPGDGAEPDPHWCWDHLQQARWYGGRGRAARLLGLTTLPWWSAPRRDQAGVRSVIAEVQFADGGPNELYHLVLAEGPGGAPVRDASTDDQALLLLWHGLRRASRRDGAGTLHASVVPGLPVSPTPRVFPGEQSNTSVRYGSVAVLKVFRRLVVGENPDLEVHRAGIPGAARLLGSATAEWFPASAGPHDPVRTADLAMLVEQVPDAHDGWTLALEAAAAGRSFENEAGQLGTALRRVHRGLADAFGTTEVDGSAVAARLVTGVAARAEAVSALAPYRAGLVELCRRLEGQTLTVQRIHGDCHLGQVLRGSDGTWTVIDFEGEPLKPRRERVRPDSPMRDVAGMLRSFAYVRATLGRSTATPPGRDWESAAADAFLRGYLGGLTPAADNGGPAAVLDAYRADRVAYEVAYEAGHRPDWIDIPLRDIARLTGMPRPEERP